MSSIFFCGDPHSHFAHIIEAVKIHRPAAVILLGDQTAHLPLHEELASILDLTEIWWILGNHDTNDSKFYDNLVGSTLGDRNLHGKVTTIAGLRIAGLAGVMRGKIWNTRGSIHDSPEAYMNSAGADNRWRKGLPLRHRSSIFKSDVLELSRQRADILVVHEAPDLHKHGNRAATRLAIDMGIKSGFHGHHHETITYPGGVWHGVSNCGISALDTETFEVRIIVARQA